MSNERTQARWHSQDASHVLTELESDIHRGLTDAEVKRRLEIYGYNELKKEQKVSPFVLFLNQFKNILIVILLVAIVLSALVGEVVDAVIIGVIVVFCAVLGFIQEYRAERALEALKKMLSQTITALRGGTELEVPSKELVPGDILLLEAGDKIPADARFIHGTAPCCLCHNARRGVFLTESLPVRHVNELSDVLLFTGVCDISSERREWDCGCEGREEDAGDGKNDCGSCRRWNSDRVSCCLRQLDSIHDRLSWPDGARREESGTNDGDVRTGIGIGWIPNT